MKIMQICIIIKPHLMMWIRFENLSPFFEASGLSYNKLESMYNWDSI